MSDRGMRDLERLANAGDPDAAAALKRANERLASQCAHRLVSRRAWLHDRHMRHDRFCLHCGVNLDYTPDRETLTFDDCDPSREFLRNDEADQARRNEEADAAAKTRAAQWEATRIAALRAENEWLADVADEDVLDRWDDAQESRFW